MAPASNEEQFKFLISCIRYSNNGKVDFGQVARECKIVSKGAAAKRYERMMRSHGIASNAASIKPAPNRTTTTTSNNSLKPESNSSPNSLTSNSLRRDSCAPGTVNRKRKAEQFSDETGVDDDEVMGFGGRVKCEVSRGGGVKVENGGANGMGGMNIGMRMGMGMNGTPNGLDTRIGMGSGTGTGVMTGGGSVKQEYPNAREQELRNQLSLDEAASLLQFYETQTPLSSMNSDAYDFGDISVTGFGNAEDGGGFDVGVGGEYGLANGVGARNGTGNGNRFSPTMSGGYASSVGGGFGFDTAYGLGMNSVPRSENQRASDLHYSGMMRYGGDSQGRSDSPLIVE